MGNCFECVSLRRRSNEIYVDDIPQINYDSTQSITNPSVSSRKDSVPGTISKCSTNTSPSSKFSWTRLRSMYAESAEQNAEGVNIQPLVLSVMKGVFCVIENNIGPMSRRFDSCLVEADKTFPTYFEECAGTNYRRSTDDKELPEKIRNHTIIMIHLHKKIVNLLENLNTDEAYDILKLIALSHALMKVIPSYFKFMDMVMGKFLLSNGFLYEDNAEAIVIYLNSVSDYICNRMNFPQANNTKAENTSSIPIQQTCSNEKSETATASNQASIARENYRQMKRWYSLVHDLHEEVNQLEDLEAKDAPEEIPEETDSTIATEILQQTAFIMKHFVKKKDNKDTDVAGTV